MSITKRTIRGTHAAMLLSGGIWVIGCAVSPELAPSSEGIHEERVERREQALQQFEVRRSSAQFEAARECWQRGDHAGCRRQLEQLVEREPDHREARRLLADVYLLQQQPQAAANQLRQILELDDQDAPAHHSLGLLLMNADEMQFARSHLKRAVDLDSANDLFRGSLAAFDALASPYPASSTGSTFADSSAGFDSEAWAD